MSLNATARTAETTYNKIKATCQGMAVSISQVFVSYHAGSLTYERIYNDFIPKIKTAISAFPPSESFPAGLEADLDAYALLACGAGSYTSDFKQLEIYLDELLVLTEAAIPTNTDGFALVLRGVDGGSDVIPEMLEISAKLDQITAVMG